MPGKVVSLTVHKNTLHRRKAKELRKDALIALKEMLTACDPAAVALVVIDKNQGTASYTIQGDLRPAEFSLLVKDALKDQVFGEDLTNDEELEET